MARYYSRVFVAITLSISFLSCVKEVEQRPEESSQGNLHEVIFHAGWAPETKTVLQEDGSIWWSPGDEISLCFPLKEKNIDPVVAPCIRLDFKTDDDAPLADYYIDMDNPINRANYYHYCDKRDKGLVADTVYAIYPKRSDNSNKILFTNKGDLNIYFTIPTVQIATPESFDKLAMVSIAESDGNNLGFRNLCGGIKFSVSQPGIKEVSFRSSSGETLSGSFCFIRKSGELFVDWPSSWEGSGSNEVIVRAPDDSYFEVGKYYYAVLNPLEDDSPIVVTYKKGSSKASYYTSGSTSIKRSVFKRLYDKDAGLSFQPIKDEAIMMRILPDSFRYDADDKIKRLTDVVFHPSSGHMTDENLGTEEGPVYFELKGTEVHYYTPKESFNIKNVSQRMFAYWSGLTKVDLTGVDASEATDFWECFAGTNLKSIDLSHFDTSNATSMKGMFSQCKSLESLDLSSFNTEHVTDMSEMFYLCRNLRELNLSSFKTSQCQDMSWMFCYCISLQKLDLANFDVSAVQTMYSISYLIATHRKNCIIRAPEEMKSLLCRDKAQMPEASMKYFITWVAPGEEFPQLNDPFSGLYKSTDYSKDMTYSLIQRATKGKGIDIVIMGDAYSDRLINDGIYDRDLSSAIENIFTEEPLKSLRDYFNVYITYVVSENEVVSGITALDLVFEDFPSTHIQGNGATIGDYMKATLPNYGYEFATGRPIPYTIVIANTHSHAGTCEFYTSGSTIAYSALGLDEQDYYTTVCHEFGHAIGKLADEYYQSGTTFMDTQIFSQKSSEGWWPNVDITSDPNSVKWCRFINDERYASQGLGVFEGGYADYAYGIWRPTENSIMNSASTGFNAPSREAIYERVNELADDSFVYDYESFVTFDQASWSGVQKQNNAVRRSIERKSIPLQSPVFVDGTNNPYGASTEIHR